MNGRQIFVEAKDNKMVSSKAGSVQSPSQFEQKLGLFSLLGATALIFGFTYFSGALEEVIRDLFLFYGGKPGAIFPQNLLTLSTLQILSAVASLDILSSLLLVKFVRFLIGKPKGKNGVEGFLREIIGGGYPFLTLLLCAALEELVTRWLFLSVLIKFLPGGPLSLYFLIFSSSALFASMHLENFENPKDRHWARTLPQFTGGLLHCYVFMKFGLMATIFTHFLVNALCLTACRISYKL